MATAATSNDLPLFKQLNNMQDPATVARLFSYGRRLEADSQPTFVLLVGAPGAGKTSQLPMILEKTIGKDADQFYYVSLDRLAEQVEPYRSLTHRLHQELLAQRHPQPLTDENIGLLGEVYLPMIKSTASNFSLTAKERASMKKMSAMSIVPAAALASSAKRSTRSATTAASLGKRSSMNSRKSYQPGTKTRTKRAPKRNALKSLADLVWSGLEYGIEHKYNIVYDTTFDGNFTKLKDHIMPMLESHLDQVKYHIVVVHVDAPTDVIETRLRSRYQNMIHHKSEWIRAVDPRRAELFRKKNQEGYDKAKTYFMVHKIYDHLRGRKYTHHDFEFIEYANHRAPLPVFASIPRNNGPVASTPSSLLATSLATISLHNQKEDDANDNNDRNNRNK